MELFLKKLVESHQGACFATNLLDSVSIENLPKDIAKCFLNDCLAAIDIANPLTADQAWATADMTARNYRMKGVYIPVLSEYCGPTKMIASVMRWEIFRKYYLRPEVTNDDEHGLPENSSDWEIAEIDEWAKKNHIGNDSIPGGYLFPYIEVRGKALWTTSYQSLVTQLQAAAIGKAGCAAYDALGLIHIEDEPLLVVFGSPFREFAVGRGARPTGLDGGNVRFRAINELRDRDGWGHTVDLALLENGADNIQGCPEALLDPVSFTPENSSNWRVLGRVIPRTRDKKIDDRFISKLLLEKTMKQVIRELVQL